MGLVSYSYITLSSLLSVGADGKFASNFGALPSAALTRLFVDWCGEDRICFGTSFPTPLGHPAEPGKLAGRAMGSCPSALLSSENAPTCVGAPHNLLAGSQTRRGSSDAG